MYIDAAIQTLTTAQKGAAGRRQAYAVVSAAGLLKLAGRISGYSPTRSGMWKASYLASTL